MGNTASISGTIIKRLHKETGAVEYYNNAAERWDDSTESATVFDEDIASATIRCFETTNRRDRITTFSYDTIMV
jgi:hypothetical protein